MPAIKDLIDSIYPTDCFDRLLCLSKPHTQVESFRKWYCELIKKSDVIKTNKYLEY